MAAWGDRRSKKRLTARFEWIRSGGPFALAELKKLGIEPAAEDYGPGLEWEAPVWLLYQRCSHQVRLAFGGIAGLDYGVVLPLVREKGWDMDLALELLGAIEQALTAPEKDEALPDEP